MHSTKCHKGVLFSNHLFDQSEIMPIKPPHESPVDSDSEFEFCIGSTFENDSSSADELFFNGVILPTQSKGIFHQCENAPFLASSLPPLPPPPPAAATSENSKKDIAKEFKVVNSESEKKGRSKSFWGFRRSNSLNHDCRKSSFCSLPLLSRSNSTGSVPSPKRTSLKDGKRQSSTLQREQSQSVKPSFSSSSSSSSSLFSNSSSNSYSKLQKTHSRKNLGGFCGYGNNLFINPILNIPPPYITKETANIFGLSSLLRIGKEKKSRK